MTFDKLGLALLLATLTGCPTREVSELEAAPANESRRDIPVVTNRDVDILFVIDNSISMEEEQQKLRENFPRFIDVLNTIEGGLPNVHIAVISSDAGIEPFSGSCTERGDDGKFQVTARAPCTTDPITTGELFLKDVQRMDGSRDRNYNGNLTDAFSCIAALGDEGCGLERHLDAVERSLDFTRNPLHASFLRDNAYLAVIILADEDDCSARDPQMYTTATNDDRIDSVYGFQGSFRCTEFGVECDGGPITRTAASDENCKPRTDSFMQDPQHFVDFLIQKKGGIKGLVMAAVIGGNVEPFNVFLNNSGKPTLAFSCTAPEGEAGEASPGVRLKAFTDAFSPQGRYTSICQNQLTDALDDVARLLARIVGNRCLDENLAVVDILPSEPGTQLPCTVTDVRFPGTAQESSTVIRRCDMLDATTPDTAGATAENPCWWVTPDPVCANFSDHDLQLIVERGPNGDDAVPPQTVVQARCEAL
jgi:hypothetical protein